MSKSDLRRLFRAILRFPFPAGVRRSVASDLERPALYVILIARDRFAVVAFRTRIDAASVYAELAEAVAGLQGKATKGGDTEHFAPDLGISLDRAGRDM